MLRFLTLVGLMMVLSAVYSPAKASADGSCYPEWTLYNRDLNCANSAVIAPGNDTRTNLLMLLADKQGGPGASDYPELGWDRSYQRNFFNWSLLRKAFYPAPPSAGDDNNYYGTRCVSFPSGSKAFNEAVAANRRISDADRKRLNELRAFIEDVCKGKDYWGRPPDDLLEIMTNADSVLGATRLGNKAADEYVTYLKGASDFYGGAFEQAETSFAALRKSKDKWLRETAAYMQARTQLNAAQQNSFGRWGDFEGPQSTDPAALKKAESGFGDYLKGYPSGHYAASARGLMRRIHWLRQDLGRLASEYQRLLDSSSGLDAANLTEEIDVKLLFAEGAAQQISQPLLLAVVDLMRMRSHEYGENRTITIGELEAQKDHFSNRKDLYEFLLANHAFYVEGDARKVLQLIPDAARQENFSYIQFSRQMLRGKALQKLGDPNEGGFWRDMLGGSKSLYQRPTVELGLAIFHERNGEFKRIFSPNSRIKETGIRKPLLLERAGPGVLGIVADDESRPKTERDLALFTLLYKSLSRGNYNAFLRYRPKIAADANSDAGLWRLASQEEVPVGLFGAGAQKGEYSCPSLQQTAETLARSPKNNKARLCLGDFWLANGFDYFSLDVTPNYARRGGEPTLPQLGSSKSQFPGSATPRHDFYTEIMADPRATADERAYALYRAIRCYATSGNNSCGGKAAQQSQRKAWFQRLKRSYPNSKWAKKLKYYW